MSFFGPCIYVKLIYGRGLTIEMKDANISYSCSALLAYRAGTRITLNMDMPIIILWVL
jgi:hypothetical protein